MKEFFCKSGERVHVVYVQGSLGGSGPEVIGSVFVRVKGGRVRVIGLGLADAPKLSAKTPSKM